MEIFERKFENQFRTDDRAFSILKIKIDFQTFYDNLMVNCYLKTIKKFEKFSVNLIN